MTPTPMDLQMDQTRSDHIQEPITVNKNNGNMNNVHDKITEKNLH